MSPGIPDPPAFLSDIALQEWQRVAPALAAARVLTPLDRAVLASYCALWARVLACEEDLTLRGLTVSSRTQAGKPRAYLVANPSLAILHTTLAQLRAFGSELGLSPSSRSRIKIDQPAPQSRVDAFRAKHGG